MYCFTFTKRFGVMQKLVLDNSYKTDHDVMEKGVKSFISVQFQVERTWNREVGHGLWFVAAAFDARGKANNHIRPTKGFSKI